MRRLANRRVLVALLAGVLIAIFTAATAFAKETPLKAQQACLKSVEKAKEALVAKADLCGPKT